MAQAVQTTIADFDRIFIHHGLPKIVVQYQLSLVGRSWKESLVGNGLGLTQYWSTFVPKNSRKCMVSVNLGIDDVPKCETEEDKLQKTNSPLEDDIGSMTKIKIDLLNIQANLTLTSSIGHIDTPINIDEGLESTTKSAKQLNLVTLIFSS